MGPPKIESTRANPAVGPGKAGWDTIAGQVRQHTTQIFLVGIAIGFAFLLLELVLIGHVRGTQLIAVISCVLGVGLSLAGLMPRYNVRRAVTLLLAPLALSGFALFGVLTLLAAAPLPATQRGR